MNIKFSILVPLYNTPDGFLRDMIGSVQGQIYKNWELCLTDASDDDHSYVEEVVKDYVKKDARIKYKKLTQNGGISDNTNACIDISTGNYFALLDHDDVLDKKALNEVARVIRKTQADFIYSDEAKFTTSIEDWFAPNYKPDFSKYELRAHNYICHLTVYSRGLLEKAGKYRKEYDGSQDHDMVLRLTEKANRIVHIPKILYYWRVHGESVSAGVENKSYAVDAAKNAVKAQVERGGLRCEVVTHAPFSLLYHVLYEINGTPEVTVVMYGGESSENFRRSFESLLFNAGYQHLNYLILIEKGQEKDYRKILSGYCEEQDYHIEQVRWKDKEKVNEILSQYGRDYLLFLNINSEIESKDFVKELLMLAQQRDIGFVGPKIMARDNTVKGAGIALTKAVDTGVVFRFKGELEESDGYEAGLRHIRSASAFSEECLMIQTEKFEQLGGFSKEYQWYSAIDGCLKAREKGFDNVWTPYAQVTNYLSETSPRADETAAFMGKWKKLYAQEDPYYNKAVRYDVDHIHDKNTVSSLCKKSINYLQEEGVQGLLERISVYRGGAGKRSSLHIDYEPKVAKKHVYKDVLFINGCAPTVPHPPRYRVTHQREQLEACNISTGEVYYEELNPSIVNEYRSFVFFRCPYTEQVGELIRRAKELGRLVLFDIDDLVIDTKYTDTIPYVMSLNAEEKRIYDDGVIRMGKTLKLCDGAITTTERLAEELSHYVPKVFINRNVASERMYELSEKAIYERDVLPYLNKEELLSQKSLYSYEKAKEKSEQRSQSGIRIGYFSGSITHNDDFDMIRPALIKILKKYPDTSLHLVGELDLPEELKPFKKQIVVAPFTEWEKLPFLIASVDINLAPITVSIFNEAKSENKWTEAALVKVPTVASAIGAFKAAIINNETGLLCETVDDWYEALEKLILNQKERKRLAENAYRYVVKNYITTYTGGKLANFIKENRSSNVAFILPSLEISGGIMVALKHACFLKQKGLDVFVINDNIKTKSEIKFEKTKFPVLSTKNADFFGRIDVCIATMWSTEYFLEIYRNISKRCYLVQNYETDFYEPNNPLRIIAERTYHPQVGLTYLTISEWCKQWLKENYSIEATYMPNGIDTELFYPRERSFDGKIRILIEGDSSVYYKNVDESFRIVEKLDKDKYEIWYLSYEGKPKEWYHVDKFFNRVPHAEVADIYRECHILLKSSILESFSYPPLEMMATGGFVVVVPNGGNVEYLRDGENCLMYQKGDINEAVEKIKLLTEQKELRDKLIVGGLRTSKNRSWNLLESIIIEAYK